MSLDDYSGSGYTPEELIAHKQLVAENDARDKRLAKEAVEQERLDRLSGRQSNSWLIPFFLIAPYIAAHYLNIFMPFWGRCLVAIGAGVAAAWWAGNRMDGCLVVRAIAFILVVFPLLAVFKDEYGLGQTVMKDYIIAILGLVAVAVVGTVAGGWIKSWLEGFRENPIMMGCLTIFAIWVISGLTCGFLKQEAANRALLERKSHPAASKGHTKHRQAGHITIPEHGQ